MKPTGDEEHDPCSKGAIEPLKGGEVREGHDAGNDAREARHPRQDHEGPGGVPVRWRKTWRSLKTVLQITHSKAVSGTKPMLSVCM